MKNRNLTDQQITACLKDSYGLAVTAVEFLPLGYDMYAGVYRVEAGGQTYFLKAKGDAVNELSVVLPRYLKEQGLDAVAPLPTTTGALWGKVNQISLLLYPYIEGDSGKEAGLSDDQWVDYGRLLKKLHIAPLSPELRNKLPQENFVPNPHWHALFKKMQADVQNHTYSNPVQQQLAAFWCERFSEIDGIAKRAEELGRQLEGRSVDFTTCHTDIHTANLMIDTKQKLSIVDWDQPLLAPREYDLMFVTAGFQNDPKKEALFFKGYGAADIDKQVLAYYRYARAMEDMACCAEAVLLSDHNDATRQDCLGRFKSMFEPGSLIDAAYKIDGKQGLARASVHKAPRF